MRIVAPDGKSWCRGHGAFLDVSEFGLKYPERGILQGLCRACQRKASRMYYLRDPEPYKARAKAGRRRARERNRERVREFLRANKCADCGIIEFAVLSSTIATLATNARLLAAC